MRILFVPFEWATHYYAMTSLAWAARAAGHEVRIAAHPSITAAVTGSGMIAVPIGGRSDLSAGMTELRRSPEVQRARRELSGDVGDLWKLPTDKLAHILAFMMIPHVRIAEDATPDLVEFARAWRPELIIGDPLMYAAPVAASVVGAPLVHHLLGPDFLRVMRFPGLGGDAEVGWPDGLRRLYDRYGVDVGANAPLRTVDPCPERIQVPGIPRRLPVRFVPYNGSGTLPSWLTKPPVRQRICLTWGTGAQALHGGGGSLLPELLDALRTLDVEVVVAVRPHDREQLGELPPNSRAAVDLPLDLLLPTCAVVLHQGGAQTMLTAAAHGVPQLLVPQIIDQGLVAELLTKSGAGIGLDHKHLRPDLVRESVAAALGDETIRNAAAELRREMMAQPSPAEVVRSLVRVIRA
ncbi:nucleotide disphospho-sugar-binding domain-containing protein [Nocardia wallacei]|uniref:nucleotide disphospho-sugar-binding domain-containing protein n=1 Tax=Nocardia wallacei TaxID=480035 RepID=UPI0024541774|nr:nucleotide disphospho-sugar-binding domain-containing protein [Nocardia wallacei]